MFRKTEQKPCSCSSVHLLTLSECSSTTITSFLFPLNEDPALSPGPQSGSPLAWQRTAWLQPSEEEAHHPRMLGKTTDLLLSCTVQLWCSWFTRGPEMFGGSCGKSSHARCVRPAKSPWQHPSFSPYSLSSLLLFSSPTWSKWCTNSLTCAFSFTLRDSCVSSKKTHCTSVVERWKLWQLGPHSWTGAKECH